MLFFHWCGFLRRWGSLALEASFLIFYLAEMKWQSGGTEKKRLQARVFSEEITTYIVFYHSEGVYCAQLHFYYTTALRGRLGRW